MKFIALVALLAGLVASGFGQGVPAQMKVATRVIPPFVVQSDGRLSGFSIDLWKELADRMGTKSDYKIENSVGDLLRAVKSRQADVGIAAVSITAERDKDFDFSQPMFDAGLQVLVKDNGQSGGISAMWSQIVGSGIFKWLLAIFLVGLVPAHVVWLFERKHDRGLTAHHSYFPGIFEAYWWSLACLATQAEEMPKSWLGRVVAVFWMFTAVVFVAFFTAQVTASMTVQQLQDTIGGPNDLPGKKVATTKGSTSAAYLREHGSEVLEVGQMQDAYDALDKGKVDAVVFDSPVLLYYANHQGKGKFHVVGDIFHKEYYGIVFMPNSPYRKPIERALLSLKEDGTYQEIYDRWFSR